MGLPRVIIIGGGLAGCAAAAALAKKSIDVTVIEKGKSGKEKVCGDAFVSSAVRLLDQFSIDSQYLETLGGYYCNRIEMYVNDILIHEVEYRKNGIVVLPRKIIDQEIRNIVAKNVSFRYETLVKDIQQKRSKRMSLIISNRRNNNDLAQKNNRRNKR